MPCSSARPSFGGPPKRAQRHSPTRYTLSKSIAVAELMLKRVKDRSPQPAGARRGER
jgi:hypothetical protein